jgi:hypothetical protein
MESEIIPMCEDQGMVIVSRASLGGGQLTTAERREMMKDDKDAPKGYGFREEEVKVSETLEKIAALKNATFQEIVSRFFHFTFLGTSLSSRFRYVFYLLISYRLSPTSSISRHTYSPLSVCRQSST